MNPYMMYVAMLCVCLIPKVTYADDTKESIQILQKKMQQMQQALDLLKQQAVNTNTVKKEPLIRSDEVIFSDEGAFKPVVSESLTPGWLSTFNINGNMALRYQAGNNRAFTNGFTDTFRLSDFNLDFSFKPSNRVNIALGLQMFETRIDIPIIQANQGFRTGPKVVYRNMFNVKYGYADYRLNDVIHVRFGAFLTPFGVYNESLHSDYDSKLVERPFLNLELIPTPWTQVGLQIHGQTQVSAKWLLDYTVYTGNGLEAPVNAVGIAPSNRIADMVHTLVSRYNTHRSYGGRVGVLGNEANQNVELGISGYQGAWDILARYNLTLAGVDAWYRHQGFELRGEWTTAYQQLPLRMEHKLSWYAQSSYRWKAWEPVARVDRIS